MAATRFGPVPAARAGFAAWAALAGFADFAFGRAVFFFADSFFFKFFAMRAQTIAWRKAPRAVCGRLCRGGCAGFSPQARARRKFSLGQGSKTRDRSQILPRLAEPPGFLRQHDPLPPPASLLFAPVQWHKRSAPSVLRRVCCASRPGVFQYAANSSRPRLHILPNARPARRQERAQRAPNRPRKPVLRTNWNSEVPCLLRFRQKSAHFRGRQEGR